MKVIQLIFIQLYNFIVKSACQDPIIIGVPRRKHQTLLAVLQTLKLKILISAYE